MLSELVILDGSNIAVSLNHVMPKDKELEKEWKKFEHEKMNESAHQLDLQSNYESDEEYEESEE